MYNVTRRGEWQNVVIKGALGDIHCGGLVEGFDLRDLSHGEDLTDIKGIQDIILVRRFQDKGVARRAFKLRKLEDEGVMLDQDEKKKGGKKRRGESEGEEKDYEDFLDDVAADADLRKDMKIYMNQKVGLKNMTKQQLDEVLGEIEICELLEDMNMQDKKRQIEGKEAGEGEELDGIDDLIARMDKVTIEKE